MLPVNSSFIHALGYDAKQRIATVEFKRREGYAIYQYKQVPPRTFARWLKATSKGKYFHRNIRRRYDFKRIG